MPLLIGTDEAGYGPNLGPLVIGLSAWETPAEITEATLSTVLESWIISEIPAAQDNRLPIADSKTLYQTARGLGALETAVLAVGRSLGWQPTSWRESARLFSGEDPTQPWDTACPIAVPTCAPAARIDSWEEQFQTATEATKIRLRSWRAKLVQPLEFNRGVQKLGSKGTLLSETTLRLVAECLEANSGSEPVFVTCDKHGGRDRYAAVLTHLFPDYRLEIRKESRPESCYRMSGEREVFIAFRSQGERNLPTALASMAAKYLRELAMEAFNTFWLREVPGTPPTAGYPADAKRFWEAIRSKQRELRIPDEVLWRER